MLGYWVCCIFFIMSSSAFAIEFAELEDLVLKSSIEIKNQEILQHQSKRQYYQQAIDSFLPSLDARLFTQKSRRKADNVFSNFSVDSEWQNGIQLGGQYTFLNNSQGYHQFKASQASFYQQKRETHSVRMQRLVSLTKTFLDYSKTCRQIEILNELIKIDSKTLADTNKRFQRGVLPRSEVRRARFRHLDLINELESRLTSKKTLIFEIRKMIGHDHDIHELVPMKVDQSINLSKYPLPNRTSLPQYLSQALEQNDTVKSLGHSIESAQFQKVASGMRLAPRLSLDLNYTYFQEHTVDFWADDKQSSFSSLIKLEIPLFESSQNYTDIAIAGLNKQLQMGRLKQTQIEIKENLKILIEQIDFLFQKIKRDRDQLTLSEKILNASEIKYQQGSLELRFLIEDQRFFQRQQLQTLESSYEYLKMYVEFHSIINSAQSISMNDLIRGQEG